MNTDTPTPRTDRLEYEQECNFEVAWEDECRRLERELAAVTEQRDRLAVSFKEEMEWAKSQNELSEKEAKERAERDDSLGCRYYDGLAVAYFQTMRRMSYRLLGLQSLNQPNE